VNSLSSKFLYSFDLHLRPWLFCTDNSSLFCIETLDSSPKLVDRLWAGALLDSVTSTEDQVSKARGTFGKLPRVLVSFDEVMFPRRAIPESLDALIGVFLGTDVLTGFRHEQTLSGVETVITMSQAHDIQGNFEEAFHGVPRDSSGREVDLRPYMAYAYALAKHLLAMREAPARAGDEAQRKATEEARRKALEDPSAS
jgi:hypothetical protein